MQIFHFILFYRINYVWSILFYQVKDHNVLSFSDNLIYIYLKLSFPGENIQWLEKLDAIFVRIFIFQWNFLSVCTRSRKYANATINTISERIRFVTTVQNSAQNSERVKNFIWQNGLFKQPNNLQAKRELCSRWSSYMTKSLAWNSLYSPALSIYPFLSETAA